MTGDHLSDTRAVQEVPSRPEQGYDSVASLLSGSDMWLAGPRERLREKKHGMLKRRAAQACAEKYLLFICRSNGTGHLYFQSLKSDKSTLGDHFCIHFLNFQSETRPRA